MSPAQRSTKLAHVTTISMTQWAFLRGQNHFMAERGFEIHAITSPDDQLTALAQRDPVIAHPVFISRRVTPLQDVRSLWRLYRIFRQIGPDIVEVSTPKAALLGSIAAWAARVPIRIYHIRGLLSEGESGLKQKIFLFLERLTALFCNESFSNAFSLLEYVHQHGILKAGEGKVMSKGMANGVDASRFDPEKIKPADLRGFPHGRELSVDNLVIGFVGRLNRDKGMEELVAAWTIIRDEFPHALLLLVGPWEKEDLLKAQTRQNLEKDERVIITGMQPDVAPFYRIMDLFIFPSYREGFPNAPMEAAAMAVPVVATRVNGCVDAVQEGVTGTLIPSKDAPALIEAMRMYLRDAELRRRHGQAGRQRILKDFLPHVIWEATYQEYLRLMSEQRLPLPVPRTLSVNEKPVQAVEALQEMSS